MLLLKMQEIWQYWPHRCGWQQLAQDETGSVSFRWDRHFSAQPPPLLLSYTQKALLISDKSVGI